MSELEIPEGWAKLSRSLEEQGPEAFDKAVDALVSLNKAGLSQEQIQRELSKIAAAETVDNGTPDLKVSGTLGHTITVTLDQKHGDGPEASYRRETVATVDPNGTIRPTFVGNLLNEE